jgi:transposase-like protein
MRVEVMEYYGLTQPFSQAGYYETQQHAQLLKDIKGAILEGRLIAVCGVVGSGKTVTMRRLQQQLKEENRITVSKSLSVEKHSIKLATLITALYYDLGTDKIQIPKQGERRERELRELVRKNKRPVALFVDEAHDLNRHTLTGLKRLMEEVYERKERSLQEIADEVNMSFGTLKGWVQHAKTQTLVEVLPTEKRPEDWTPPARLLALQQSHGLEGETLSAWCRQQGIFPHTLQQWRSAFCQPLAVHHREDTQEIKQLKQAKKQLEKELLRKDRALAEAAALLVLQKKLQALWGDEAT